MNKPPIVAHEIRPSPFSHMNLRKIGSMACETLPRVAARLLLLTMVASIMIGSVTSVLAQGQPTTTRQDLEPSFKTYLEGCSARDFQKIKPLMADALLATIRNRMVSLKKPFPPATADDLSAWDEVSLATFISFEKLTFVALKKNGPRAILTFRYPEMAKSSQGVKDGVFTADFVYQHDEWKLFKLSGLAYDDLNAKFDAGDLSFLDGPEYTPTAEIPEIPPTATPADYIAQCQWYIPTGKFVVTVNGIPNEMDAMSGFHLILGGLKKGENRIRIHYDPDAKVNANVGMGDPKLRIRVFTGDDLRLGTDRQLLVYKWKPDAGDYEETIQMDDEILAKLPKPEMTY